MPYAVSSTPDPSRSPSRVTNHLANERTFLAWVRTAARSDGTGLRARPNGTIPPADDSDLAAMHPAECAVWSRVHGHRRRLSPVRHRSRRLDRLALREHAPAIDLDRYEPARSTVLALTAVVVIGRNADRGPRALANAGPGRDRREWEKRTEPRSAPSRMRGGSVPIQYGIRAQAMISFTTPPVPRPRRSGRRNCSSPGGGGDDAAVPQQGQVMAHGGLTHVQLIAQIAPTCCSPSASIRIT